MPKTKEKCYFQSVVGKNTIILYRTTATLLKMQLTTTTCFKTTNYFSKVDTTLLLSDFDEGIQSTLEIKDMV